MSDKKEKSWIFCEHANECPIICPCPADCICRDKGNMCEHKPLKEDVLKENSKKNCSCGCSNVKGISHEQYKKNLADSFSQIKDTGGPQSVVGVYTPFKPYDWSTDSYTYTTTTFQPEQPLQPMQKVVINFKDGEERTGFFICDISATKCFIISELTTNPPGWYVEKNSVKAFVK